MPLKVIITSLILFFSVTIFCQERTITGKIIESGFDPLYPAKVFNKDTLAIATTDLYGNFK